MKKAKLAILTAAACMAMLAGCGSMDVQDPAPDTSPYVTDDLVNDMTPGIDSGDMMPDADDGVVNDTDGIIDDGDTGVQNSARRGMNNARNAIGNAMDDAKNAIDGITGKN